MSTIQSPADRSADETADVTVAGAGSTSALDRFYAVIPAGGVGTRLWPLSRAAAPKFLHDLTGSGHTLIRATWDRLEPLASGRIMVVTGRAHHDAVVSQLPELDESNIVLESEPKDSGAAIGLAAAILHRRDPSTIMGSFAADHAISPDSLFRDVVTEAVTTAAQGYIVTIGIKPTYPSTGFGYIKQGEPLGIEGAPNALRVDEFVEKPSEETASEYLAAGSYCWNAGMFVAPVELMLNHLERSQPELYAGLQEIAQAWDTDERDDVVSRVWPTLPKIAIDYAVAEPAAAAGDVAVVPADFRWDDVGDFAAIGRLNPAGSGVTVLGTGRVVTENATGVVVSGTNRLIALLGVENIVVVDTPDALLVTTAENAQAVKKTVEQLKADGIEDVL